MVEPDVSVEPEYVKASAGPEVFVSPYIVPEDVAVKILTTSALAVVSYIERAGTAVKKHVPGILFESRFGMVLADDKFRMGPYLGCFSALGVAAKTLGRCPNRFRVNIIYQFRHMC